LFAVPGRIRIRTNSYGSEFRSPKNIQIQNTVFYICELFLFRTPLATTFVAAGEELGYMNRDGNGEYQTGFMIAQVM
jgi:hypothetical protein